MKVENIMCHVHQYLRSTKQWETERDCKCIYYYLISSLENDPPSLYKQHGMYGKNAF